MKKLFTILFTLVSLSLVGQDTLKLKHFDTWSITPFIGTSYENMDLEENDPFYTSTPINFGFGVDVSKQLSHHFSGHLNYFNTKLTGSGVLIDYTNKINQLDLRFRLNLTNGHILRNWRSTQLFVYAGYGVLWYDATRSANGVVVDEAKDNTRVLPVGVGGKYRLGNRTALSADLSFNMTNSDNLDGWRNHVTARDGYTRLSVGVSYSFGKKKILEWDNPYTYLVPEVVHDTTVVLTTIKYEAPPVPEVVWPDSTTIYFVTSSYSIEEPYLAAIDSVVDKAIKEDKTKFLCIRAYVDTTGLPQTNQILVEKRAKSVADYVHSRIVGETGTDVSSFTAIFLHDESAATYAPNARNRKVILSILQ